VGSNFKALFVSDIHISGMRDPNAELFLKFLTHLDTDTTHLFLLGDIFDLWVENHPHFAKKFSPIVDRLKTIAASGVDVNYFEGNHDFHIKKFWHKNTKVKVFEGPHDFKLGSLKVRIEHGDESNPEDLSYLRLRRALRSLPVRTLFANAPGRLVAFVGENWSKISRATKPFINEKVKSRSREYAKETSKSSDFDFLIAGHIHMRDEYSFLSGERKVEYVNLGTWLVSPSVYMVTEIEHRFINL